MKKVFITILAVLMLIAFVACSPDANAGGNSESLLPGEVTPPAESATVSASDDDIDTVIFLLSERSDGYKKTEYTEMTVLECTDYNKNTLSLEFEDHMDTDTKYSADGQIVLNGETYKFENYVLTKAWFDGKYSHEGSALIDGEEMTDEVAYRLVQDLAWDFSRYKNNCSAYTLEDTRIIKNDLFDENEKKVGYDSYVMVTKENEKKSVATQVFDAMYGKNRAQCKISKDSNSKDYTCEYIALNGKFFDKASIAKFMKKIS